MVQALPPIDLVDIRVLDRKRFNLETDNTDARRLPLGVLVVQNGESKVVEEKNLGRLCVLLLGNLLAWFRV